MPKLSSQKLNDHIKDCCEEAEINTRVHYVVYSGGKAREHSEPKWKLITNIPQPIIKPKQARK
jgi:hypothetical protein